MKDKAHDELIGCFFAWLQVSVLQVASHSLDLFRVCTTIGQVRTYAAAILALIQKPELVRLLKPGLSQV